MERVKRRDAKTKTILLMVLAVGIMLAVVGSTTSAAPAPAAASAVKSATVFDPFSLKTVVSSGAPASNPPAGGLIKNPNPRRPIRIPARPNCRSGFRPHHDC